MISASRVTELFTNALFKPEEITQDGSRPLDESLLVTAKGVRINAGFHKERLELARNEVKIFLAQLPLNFRADKNLPNAGGGSSFLQSCTLAGGELWTGLHQVCEQLLLLGGALGYVHRMDELPVESLPGGVPYFAIDLGAGTEHNTPTETLN